MKKLLQINSVANAGGSTGRIAEQIGRAAISEGWESYIGYGRNARQSESQLISIGSSFDTNLHGVRTRIFDRHALGRSSRNATKHFVKKIDQINPDIIHFHNLHGYYINIEVLFAFLSKKKTPLVWTLHDCWGFTGHCAHFEQVGCEKWKTKCYNCPLTRIYP